MTFVKTFAVAGVVLTASLRQSLLSQAVLGRVAGAFHASAGAMAVIGALSQMTQKRIRHLPVVDGGQLVGFVSIGDLVKYRIDRIEAEAAAMRDYIAS